LLFSIYCNLKCTVHKNQKIKIFNYLWWYMWRAKFEKNLRGSGSKVLKIWFSWHGMTPLYHWQMHTCKIMFRYCACPSTILWPCFKSCNNWQSYFPPEME